MRKLFHLAGLVMAFAFLVLAPAALALPDPVGPAPNPVADFFNNPVMRTAVGAPVIALLVQLLKAIPIPFTGQTRTGIVAALVLVTLGVELVLALLAGNPGAIDFATWLPRVVEAAMTLLGAAGLYSTTKKLARG